MNRSQAIKINMLENSTFKSWMAGLSAALFFFFEFILMQMGGTLRTEWMQAFDLNTTEFSLLASMFLYGNTLFLIPAGILLDRYSLRAVLLIVIPLTALSTLGFAWTHSLYVAALFRFLQGAGNAFCFLTCVLVTSQWFPAQWRGLVMGLMVTIAMLGGMVAQAPLALLVMQFGYQLTLSAVASIGILVGFMFFIFVQDKRSSHDMIQGSFAEECALFKTAIRSIDNWLYGLYICLLNLPVMVIVALWGITYLQTAHHLSLTQAASVNSFILFGTIMGSPLLGSLSDKFEKRQTVMIAGAIASLMILAAILFLPMHSMWSLTLLFFMLGFASSAQVIGYPVITEKNSTDLQAKATAIASIVIMGGAAIFENLTGWMLSHQQPPHVIDFQHAFSVLLVGFAISIWICWRDLRASAHINHAVTI